MHEALNHAKLAMLFRREFELCKVQKGETIVLLSDLGARRDYVAAAFAAAEDFGADAYEMCVHADQRLKRAKTMRITRPGGTDLTVNLGEYPTMSQYGYSESKGRFDHWGAGHVHTFPNEGSANGTVVLQPGDIIVLPYCRYVQDEVRLDIREGFVRKIEGGLDAKLMGDWLDGNKTRPDDMDGHAISHLGWGLNPQGRWDAIALNGADPMRHHAGARCFAGNFLFSTGPNSQGGGKRTTKGHYDVPMRDCTVTLDNDVIIERGRFTDEKMRVMRVAR